MLKNKEQRKQFLEDLNNWEVVLYNDYLGLHISEMQFTDNTSLLRIAERNQFIGESVNYRTLSKRGRTKYLGMSMTINFCIDYLQKRDIKNNKTIE